MHKVVAHKPLRHSSSSSSTSSSSTSPGRERRGRIFSSDEAENMDASQNFKDALLQLRRDHSDLGIRLFDFSSIQNGVLILPNGDMFELGEKTSLGSGNQGQAFKVAVPGEEVDFLVEKRFNISGSTRELALYEAYCLQVLKEKFPDCGFFPKFYGIVQNDDGSYSVYESLVPGTSLSRLSSEEKSPSVSYRFLKSLLDGLSKLSEAGIIHGDASGKNIFMSLDDDAYFIDFGTALIRWHENYADRFPGGQYGTPGTISTELIAHCINGVVPNSVDYFSVFSSVAFYLTGRYFCTLYGGMEAPSNSHMHLFQMGKHYDKGYAKVSGDKNIHLLLENPELISDAQYLKSNRLDLFFCAMACPNLEPLTPAQVTHFFDVLFPNASTFEFELKAFLVHYSSSCAG
jgi:serine/threonine protein kinase